MGSIFVSYARLDAATVDRLIAKLGAAGHDVWFDREGLRGGEQWRRQIVAAIDDCEVFIIALSPNSVKSDNVRKELDLAESAAARIVPVEIAPVEISAEMRYQLAGIHRIDLVTDFDAGITRLLHALGGAQAAVDDVPRPASPPSRLETTFNFFPNPNPMLQRLEETHALPPNLNPGPPSEAENDLFPLSGVSLGETTASQLAKLGKRAERVDSDTGEPYQYYEIDGMDFYYGDEQIARSMYLTYWNNPIPKKWQALGFGWKLSYSAWISLFRRMGYSIDVAKAPSVQWTAHRGHDSFSAVIVARKQTRISLELKLTFAYREGTTVDSQDTLYSIYVIVAQ